MDQKRFEEAKRKIIGVDRQRLGIGTLSEKTVHAIFKDYYDCLLYTSPSPRDGLLSRMPSSA